MNPENENKEELTAAEPAQDETVQEPAEEASEEAAEETAAEAAEEATEETAEETAAEAAEEATEETAEETEQAEEAPESGEPKKKVLSKGTKIGIIIAAVVVVLGLIAGGVVWYLSAHPELTMKKVETAYGDTAYLPEENAFGTSDITTKDRYDITDTTPDSVEMMTAIGRDKDGAYFLTNGDLQAAYWMDFYQMMNTYGAYASMMGLDTTKPLYQQQSLVEGNTWEQYFLSNVLLNLTEFRTLSRAAEASGYTLPEDVETQLSSLISDDGDLAMEALTAGFDTLDEYLQENFGAGVTAKNYLNYMRLYITAMYYYQDVLYGEPYASATEAEVEAYFDSHTDTYSAKNLTKANDINVRHILITPQGEKDSDGNYSEEAWAAAETEANRIYALWQQDATEDHFSELAKEYSKDNNASDGGLYENVYPGQMLTEFNDWCFDSSRKTGDSGIVRTQYGYHIMYFGGVQESRTWFETAKQDLATELADEKITELKTTYPVEIDYSNIRIFDMVTYAATKNQTDASEATDTGSASDSSAASESGEAESGTEGESGAAG